MSSKLTVLLHPQCTVQQTGSIEEESIGYKHHRIKNYQDIQDLL
jgi:hypothetical protein